MHDPMVVAFEVKLPIPRRDRFHSKRPGDRRWTLGRRTFTGDGERQGKPVYPWWRPRGYQPRLAGRTYRWRSFITVWHVEPGGADSGTVCKHHIRVQDADGNWTYKTQRRWYLHIHHWHLQWHQYQHARRSLLTRCEWCRGRSTRQEPVNCSHQWDSTKGRWWRGERGLYHADCSSIAGAHRACLCPDGEGIWDHELGGYPYGFCFRCRKRRPWRSEENSGSPAPEANRILASIPEGKRDPAKTAQVQAMWKAYRSKEVRA